MPATGQFGGGQEGKRAQALLLWELRMQHSLSRAESLVLFCHSQQSWECCFSQPVLLRFLSAQGIQWGPAAAPQGDVLQKPMEEAWWLPTRAQEALLLF